jgi:hypothetical protein
MKIGEAYVDVRAKDDKLKPDLRKAEREIDQSTDKIQKKVDSINFKQAGVAAAAFATVFAAAMYKTIGLASDLEETVGKFDVVFTGQRKLAESWAKELVGSYAMATIEAKKHLSAMQDLLVPMGMNAKAAGEMSFNVVKLSADLGSFNNLPTAQVMLDIQSAMVGNYETMKKYGVVLKASTVDERALADGMAKTKGELNASIRAQTAYKMIVEGSSFAIGDQERTMGSYANQMKLLKATIVELATSYGEHLLPAATEFLVFLNTNLPGAYRTVMDTGIAFTGSILENFIHIEYAAKTSWEGVRLAQFKAMDEMKLAWATWTEIVAVGMALVLPAEWIQNMIDFAEATRASVVETESFAAVTARLREEKETALVIHKATIDAMYAEAYAVKVVGDAEDKAVDKTKERALARKELFQLELAAMEERAARMIELAKIEDEVNEEFEKSEKRRLLTVADFNTQYAVMGKSSSDVERMQLNQWRDAQEEALVDVDKLKELYAEKSRAISKAENAQRLSDIHSTVSIMTDGFKMISEMGGKRSKEAFVMYKAFKIIETTIATYSAAMKAFEALAFFPPAAYVAAGMVTAFGMAQVAMISQAQPPSYETGIDYVSETGLAMLHEGEQVIPKTKARKVEGSQKPTVNIILNNPVFQDLETQRQVMAQIAGVVAAQVAPGAVVENYQDDGEIRQMVRGGM